MPPGQTVLSEITDTKQSLGRDAEDPEPMPAVTAVSISPAASPGVIHAGNMSGRRQAPEDADATCGFFLLARLGRLTDSLRQSYTSSLLSLL